MKHDRSSDRAAENKKGTEYYQDIGEAQTDVTDQSLTPRSP